MLERGSVAGTHPPSKRWTNKKCAVLFCLHLRNNLSKQELYLVPQIFSHHKMDESINTRQLWGEQERESWRIKLSFILKYGIK